MLKKVRQTMVAPSAQKLRIGIVAARYNATLVGALMDSTLKTLSEAGVRSIRTVRVPGSYEIPVAAMALARSRKYDAVVALGVVLRGKTAHADHIGIACAIHLQRIAVETGIPVIHQILTPQNLRDAKARVRLRGMEAAQTAVEMAVLMKNI